MLLDTTDFESHSGVESSTPEQTSLKKDLSVNDLVKSFAKEQTPVLNGVSFSVANGESVALIGANGTGKSTLLRCCIGLLTVDSGDISILGNSIVGTSDKDLRATRSRCAFIFQKHNLVPRLSALSNVIHGCQAWESGIRTWHQVIAKTSIREYAMYCLEQVGLAHIAHKRVDQLSGGQSQRVAIARALMQKPVMMIADEPVASLDPNAGEEVMALFIRLIREEGITLVFSSHHIHHALNYADRVVGLRNGIVDLDAPAQTLEPSQLRGFYE